MARAERVIFTLVTLKKTRQSALLANGRELVAPIGEDFVGVGLMADVPDQLIFRGIKHIVQGNSELYSAKAGSKVPTCSRRHLDQKSSEFVRQLDKLILLQQP